ncbi:hypothetical protein EHP00_1150 [Ecytonucleospora hepatopenaei]|uniref:C2H2-type domain-containing protein n=1 Tax=Ecytonucleospora hepatopenaei TaxID=646526 RepID=A0A1W0E4C2_9MICR|nr:hypothetical protein EHP00_1150 [Ecytonucleospora hepatopenaei]
MRRHLGVFKDTKGDEYKELKWIYAQQDKLLSNGIGYSFKKFFDSIFTSVEDNVEYYSFIGSKDIKWINNDINHNYKKATKKNEINFECFENDFEENDHFYAELEKNKQLRVIYHCCSCDKAFFSEKGYDYHLYNAHSIGHLQIDNFNLITRVECVQIQKEKKKKEFKCIGCNKIYKNHNGLKYHNIKHHGYTKRR